jgi:dihydrofolate reductase
MRSNRLYLTLVAGEYEADVFFPEYGEFTQVVEEETGSEGEYVFRFVTLEKN